MKINYNINHNILKLECFDGLKGQERRAMLIALSMIHHFTKNVGECHFYQGQMSKDWDISPRFFRAAINTLKEENLVKEIRPYSRKEQLPAVYVTTTGCSRKLSKLCTRGSKSVVPRTMVNNYDNNYKQEIDDSLSSSSTLLMEKVDPPAEEPKKQTREEIIQQIKKNKQL